jgi:hypothetical protein
MRALAKVVAAAVAVAGLTSMTVWSAVLLICMALRGKDALMPLEALPKIGQGVYFSAMLQRRLALTNR